MRDINNLRSTVQNIKKVSEGEKVQKISSHVPIVRRIVREYPDNTGRYFDAKSEFDIDLKELDKTTRLEKRRELLRDKPWLKKRETISGLMDRIKSLNHLEKGEMQVNDKWVKRNKDISAERKEMYHKRKMELQERVLKLLEK